VGEMLCLGGGEGGGRGEGEGGRGGRGERGGGGARGAGRGARGEGRTGVRAACSRRLTCPLLPNVNARQKWKVLQLVKRHTNSSILPSKWRMGDIGLIPDIDP
jgi:hypothetical protein